MIILDKFPCEEITNQPAHAMAIDGVLGLVYSLFDVMIEIIHEEIGIGDQRLFHSRAPAWIFHRDNIKKARGLLCIFLIRVLVAASKWQTEKIDRCLH